jgi:hypothetical protein
MNEEHDMDKSATVNDGGKFDPRAAATLLEQTTKRAERQFEFPSPVLSLIQAAALLAAYGVVWLSVRDQHPYSGPTLGALAALYVFVAVAAVAAGSDLRRATTGDQRALLAAAVDSGDPLHGGLCRRVRAHGGAPV